MMEEDGHKEVTKANVTTIKKERIEEVRKKEERKEMKNIQ